MKKGIGKTISIIAILTMSFQVGIPIIPTLQTEILAANTAASEKAQNNNEKEDISREYEIKEEETWDISANGDGSDIAKWTREDCKIEISGKGTIGRSGISNKTQYANLVKEIVIG